MLSEPYCQNYQTFQRSLQLLQRQATQANPDTISLQSAFLEAQQIFQMQIISLDCNGLDPAIAAQLQSIQTEISKQLRLVATDVMFLQAARKAITTQQRQAQMGDRIRLLLSYCDAVLGSEG